MSATVDVTLDSLLGEVFGCSVETASSIRRFAVERRFRAQTIILRQGEPADATYLVASGRAHAIVYGPDGQEFLLEEYCRGDLFGAVAESQPAPESATVIAVEELRAAVFRILDFLGLSDLHRCVGQAVSRMLLKQLRSTRAKITERSILSAPGRVYAELLRLARLADGRTIRPAPVHTLLALKVHSTRETVSRAISALERRGIIQRERDGLVIVAPHRLEELVI